VRQLDAVRERTLEITFAEPGAKAYAFTSGLGAKGYRPSDIYDQHNVPGSH